jgi:hypothetical protein
LSFAPRCNVSTLANLRFPIVRHFNRFVFLHQLTLFRNHVSATVAICRD